MTKRAPELRMIKVGGSLLDLPQLVPRLAQLLDESPPARNVLLAGGGRLADGIRHYDELWKLPSETAHQLAAATMSITARLLAELTGHPLVDAVPPPRLGAQTVVLDPTEMLAAEPEAPGLPLALDWSVTSDSIAARLAHISGADELWLLKSQDAPYDNAEQLARAGIVDPQFPRYAGGLRWRLVNLRAVSTTDSR